MDDVRGLRNPAPADLDADAIYSLATVRRAELQLNYAGAVTPQEAWRLMRCEHVPLVDVRTAAEYKFVGRVPGSTHVEWRGADAQPATTFVQALREKANAEQPLLLLCRSGVRSDAAARVAAAAGFKRVYNVLEGFEGQIDAAQQRGRIDGWRRHGLPWVQD